MMMANGPRLLKFILLMLVIGFVAIPLLATMLGGFKSVGDLRTNPFGLPIAWESEHYLEIILSGRIWRLLSNSVIISSLTLVLTVSFSAMAAFVFAHIRFFGSRLLMNYLLLGLMFPAATAVLPLFLMVRDIGLLDSYWGVILPQVAFGLAFSILLFRTFFEQLPEELFEAAQMDGCSYVRFFWSITLPLSTPIIATVGVFIGVQSWNNFLLPLVILNSPDAFPWPLGVMRYQGEFGTEWNKVLAFITLTIAPAIIFFLAAQKYIVAGLTGGAVKG
jgi:raffinose/stachyose/melibiose transport system permease protein